MPYRTLIALLLLAGTAAWTVTRPPDIAFTKHTLDLGANEPVAVADVNGDGKPDLVSGENWYEGPKWIKHRFRNIEFEQNYIEDFSDLPLDVNGDGKIDIVSCGWHNKRLWWSENPGKGGGMWKDHDIETGFPIEFAFLVDLDNDGKALEVLPQFGNAKAPLAWYEAKNGAMVKHQVSPQSYGHGIGVGDVNGDKRNDILTPKGWFEAPADPRNGDWKWHPDWNFEKHLSFMYMTDVNGDGRPDLLSANGHDYGIFWMEQLPGGKWGKPITIDESFSQPHALNLVDLNGDGRLDLVTGKRFMAHNGKDPGEREPLGVYWFESVKNGNKIEWVRHTIDYGGRAGGGTQISVADLDSDGDLDIAVAGKSGVYLFENLTKSRK